MFIKCMELWGTVICVKLCFLRPVWSETCPDVICDWLIPKMAIAIE